MTNLKLQPIENIDEDNNKIISSAELEAVLALIENDEIDDAGQLDELTEQLGIAIESGEYEDKNGYISVKMHTPMTQGIVKILRGTGIKGMNEINIMQKKYLNDIFDINISLDQIQNKYSTYFDVMDVIVSTLNSSNTNRGTSQTTDNYQLDIPRWIDFCKINNIKSFVYGHESGGGENISPPNPTPSNPEIKCLDMHGGSKNDLLRTQR